MDYESSKYKIWKSKAKVKSVKYENQQKANCFSIRFAWFVLKSTFFLQRWAFKRQTMQLG